MLVEAAGNTPGRAIGVNGVFGNLGVALAPMATAFLAQQFGWRAAFIIPGALFAAVGLAYLRVPACDDRADAKRAGFPDIPQRLVRRAVIVVLLIAILSGVIFNAFTLLLPKLMQERLASKAEVLPLVGVFAFGVTLCGAVTQFTVGRLIDRYRLKRVFLPLAFMLTPAMVGLSFADGWPALILAAVIAALLFGQLTINETMAARYVSPAMRTRMYSVRFFVGFLGSAAAAPLVGLIHDRTGSTAAVIMVLSAFALIVLGCAFYFPDRAEELKPELWGAGVVSAAE
jgi:predicted MFS family arabinose efflux permease